VEHQPGYVAYALATVIFVAIGYTMAWAILRGFGFVYRLIKLALWPISYAYRKWTRIGKHPEHLCRHKCREADGTSSNCMEPRHRFHWRNLSPFCASHLELHKSLRCEKARRFDCERLPFTERFYRREPEVEKLLQKQLKEAEKSTHADGFLYVYVSQYDLDHQRFDKDKLPADDTFFYKIGMTTRTPYQRIKEQRGAVFLSGAKRGIEGQDYFRVSKALSAEKLVFAKLADVRYRRFDCGTVSFQKEWFLATKDLVLATMEKAVDIVNSNSFEWN